MNPEEGGWTLEKLSICLGRNSISGKVTVFDAQVS